VKGEKRGTPRLERPFWLPPGVAKADGLTLSTPIGQSRRRSASLSTRIGQKRVVRVAEYRGGFVPPLVTVVAEVAGASPSAA